MESIKIAQKAPFRRILPEEMKFNFRFPHYSSHIQIPIQKYHFQSADSMSPFMDFVVDSRVHFVTPFTHNNRRKSNPENLYIVEYFDNLQEVCH